MNTDAQIIRHERAVRSLADPKRRNLLLRLSQPESATGLSRTTGMPRQRINYHLRELQRAGLVRLVRQRKKRNCTERLVQATAASYVLSSEVLGGLAADPATVPDKLSAAYLAALAARTIQELAVLRERADAVGKPVPTFSSHSDICFPSQQALAGFTQELALAVVQLIEKYAQPGASGRTFRLVIGAYPAITKTEAEARAETKLARRNQSQPPEK